MTEDIKELINGPWQVDCWSSGKIVVQAHHGSTDLALELNGNFEDTAQIVRVAEHIAHLLNLTQSYAYTYDGVSVMPGDRVWVVGIEGICETTVQKPLTDYAHNGFVPVSLAFSSREAANAHIEGMVTVEKMKAIRNQKRSAA